MTFGSTRNMYKFVKDLLCVQYFNQKAIHTLLVIDMCSNVS